MGTAIYLSSRYRITSFSSFGTATIFFQLLLRSTRSPVVLKFRLYNYFHTLYHCSCHNAIIMWRIKIIVAIAGFCWSFIHSCFQMWLVFVFATCCIERVWLRDFGLSIKLYFDWLWLGLFSILLRCIRVWSRLDSLRSVLLLSSFLNV